MHDHNQYHQVACIFYALRESTQHLELWYKIIKAVTHPDMSTHHIHPWFCPTPNTYYYKNTLVKFAYQTPLKQSDSCVTYHASTIKSKPKDIVVKFITDASYGNNAHKKMALLGFIPELFYCGPIKVMDDMPLYGKRLMVVMGYMEGLMLKAALQQRKVPPRFKDDLTQAFEELHGAGYMFGDLQEPNDIVTPDLEGTSMVQLINFN
ncbi:hypothetical protein J3R82DRAFT_4858 [Butyriboletus roseoflavus]|nr:hypothetical protein J3R82DRAFT_4858 [Butyriboletus roseoflavus]